jgi:hypothetical protein
VKQLELELELVFNAELRSDLTLCIETSTIDRSRSKIDPRTTLKVFIASLESDASKLARNDVKILSPPSLKTVCRPSPNFIKLFSL